MTQTFVRSSVLNVIAGLSTTCAGFLSTILVARVLGVEGAGVVAFASWLVTMAVVVADLGIPGALARFLPELRGSGRDGDARGLTGLLLRRLSVVLIAITLGFSGYAAATAWLRPGPEVIDGGNYRDVWLFWALVAVSCLTQGLASFANGYLKGREAFRHIAVLAVVGGTVQVLATLIGVRLFGIAGALAAAAIGALLPAAVGVAVALRAGGAIEPKLKQRVDRFAWETWGSYLVMSFAWSRMEIFFLERSWGSEAAGIFSVSLNLTNLATQAPMLLTGAFLPFLSRHSAGQGTPKTREAYATGMRLMALIVFPACIGVAAIAPKLLPALFGPDFARAIPTAMVLLAAASVTATASIATTYLFAVERTRVVFASGALGAALAIVVGLAIVPTYGAIAAAIGRGAIQVFVVLVTLWYIQRHLGCRTPFRSLGLLLLAALACGAAAFVVVSGVPGAASLPLAIAAGGCVYGLSLRILRPLPSADLGHLTAACEGLPGWAGRPLVAFIGMFQPRAREPR